MTANCLRRVEKNVILLYGLISDVRESDFAPDLIESVRDRIGPIYDFLEKKVPVLISFELYDSKFRLDQVAVKVTRPIALRRPKYVDIGLDEVLRKPSLQPKLGPFAAAWLIVEGRKRLQRKFKLRFGAEGFDWSLITLLSGYRPSENALKRLTEELLKRGAVKACLSSMGRLGRPTDGLFASLPEEERLRLLAPSGLRQKKSIL